MGELVVYYDFEDEEYVDKYGESFKFTMKHFPFHIRANNFNVEWSENKLKREYRKDAIEAAAFKYMSQYGDFLAKFN